MGIAAGALLAGGGAAAAGATTAGVVGAGLAGASIASSREASKASRKAGRTQAAAADRAVAETRRQFEQTREDLAPFREAGTGALPGLTDLVTDPEAQRDFITDNPFFTALAEDAQSRIFQNKAAKGKLGSGETAEALQNSLLLLGSDLLNQNITQRQNLVGTGQSAAAQTGQFGAQAARSIADLGTSGAAARAAGTVGAANVRNQTFQGLLNAGATFAGETGLSLSDRRHKKDIKKLGEDEHGLGVYRYKFKGDDKERVGHMAQEVRKKFPKAVKTIADVHLIDYGEMEAS